MRTSNQKPWWERVADFNESDQEEFLRGVFQGKISSRPPQPNSYIMGLSAGYRDREFVQPKSHTGKANDRL